MDAFELVVAVTGALAALGATYFSWQAIREARESVRLQREERVEQSRERLLTVLQDLQHATFDWGDKAARVMNGTPAFLAVEARARYQVALTAAALEFDLPRCEALSKEANVERVVVLSQHALDEIASKREKVAGSDRDRI